MGLAGEELAEARRGELFELSFVVLADVPGRHRFALPAADLHDHLEGHSAFLKAFRGVSPGPVLDEVAEARLGELSTKDLVAAVPRELREAAPFAIQKEGLLAFEICRPLWLAYQIATAPPLAAQTASSGAPSLLGGTLLGVANPKAWVAIAAVFASARLAEAAITDAAVKFAVLTAMIILICTVWLIAGASLARLLRDPRPSRIINVALATALVGATALAVVH